MEVFLDIQCFKKNFNELVIKELSAVTFDKHGEVKNDQKIFNVLFKPPCTWCELAKPYQVMNSWLTRNLHGIPWDAGTTAYDKLEEKLEEILINKTCIYVKGVEKKEWLERMIEHSIPIENLNDLNCPSIRKLTGPTNNLCKFQYLHKNVQGSYNWCALQNVQRLKMWYIEEYYKTELSSSSKSIDVCGKHM